MMYEVRATKSGRSGSVNVEWFDRQNDADGYARRQNNASRRDRDDGEMVYYVESLTEAEYKERQLKAKRAFDKLRES